MNVQARQTHDEPKARTWEIANPGQQACWRTLPTGWGGFLKNCKSLAPEDGIGSSRLSSC